MQVPVGPAALLPLVAVGLLGAVTIRDRLSGDADPKIAYVGAVALALLARIPHAQFMPSHDDSAIYFGDIERIVVEGPFATSQPEHIGVELVMAAFYLVFGQAGPNLASLVAAIATAPVMGLVARSLFDSERVGIATALVVAVLPLHIFYSSLLLMEPIALFVFAAVLWATVERRWRLAGVLSVVLLFMRFEYLLITVPLAVVRATESRRVRRAVVALPFVPLIGGILLGSIISFTPEQAQLFYQPVAQYLPIGAAFIGRFMRRPIFHLHLRHLYYVPQLLYWGVPFFSLPLANPLLPLLALVGVGSLTDSDTWTRRGLLVMPVAVGLMFVYRELTELGLIPPVYLLTLAFATVVVGTYVYVAWTEVDPQLEPFAVLSPYIVLLSLRITAPRYLLPLVFVGTLYTGYGLVICHDRIVAGDIPDDRIALVSRIYR